MAFRSASREADIDSIARAWFFLRHEVVKKSSTRFSLYLPGVVELLFLLGHTPVNLLLDLSKLKLGTEDLVLLLLEGALGLLQSSLQLLLLLLKATPLLVQVVDGAATLTELIQEILDLISKVLVLALGIEISKQFS